MRRAWLFNSISASQVRTTPDRTDIVARSSLHKFPDCQPSGVAERIAARSAVLAQPFDPSVLEAAAKRP
jgi:hypothetical protein